MARLAKKSQGRPRLAETRNDRPSRGSSNPSRSTVLGSPQLVRNQSSTLSAPGRAFPFTQDRFQSPFGDPMLKYVTTNIFESPAQTLVNTVNTVGVMGKGIAADFKRRYPEMFRAYKGFCAKGQFDVGMLYLHRTAHKWVLNFPTKEHWRKPSKLEWIELGLKKFVDTYTAQGITSVSFPQLGCGNGGLAWDEVRLLMERYLLDLPIPVYVHVRKADGDFVPEHLDKDAKRKLQRHREALSLQTFLLDVLEAADQGPNGPIDFGGNASDEPAPLPLVRLGGHVFSGEDLEDLWNTLSLRGAVNLGEFPGTLRAAPEVIRDLLLKLEYLEPMDFVGTSGRTERGIRFAPAPALQAPKRKSAVRSR
jgi:O-acetyl-ADP-ribose deacetylase (regulator of RNase III)